MESFRKHAASFLVTVLVPAVPVMAKETSSVQETSTRASSDEKYWGTKLPRYEQPTADNPYYFSNRNIFYASNYGMPNCTAYAWGRAYEYYGTRPSLSYYNAGQWWYDNIEWGAYECGICRGGKWKSGNLVGVGLAGRYVSSPHDEGGWF